MSSRIDYLRREVHRERRARRCVDRGQRLVGAAAPGQRTFVRREVEREEGAKLSGRFWRAGEGVRELRGGAKTF